MGEDMTQTESAPEFTSAPRQKRGRFKITHKMFVEDFEAIQGIFQLCVPVRAEMMYDRDCIEYTAIGHVFDEVPEGSITPWYAVKTDRDGLTVGVEFRRRENIHG